MKKLLRLAFVLLFVLTASNLFTHLKIPGTNLRQKVKRFELRSSAEDLLLKRGSRSTTICEMVKASSFEFGNVTIARLLGPSFPPLQSPQQLSLNLHFTLSNEISLHKSKSCIRSLWIINCMFNRTELHIITETLIRFEQEFFHVPGCPERDGTELRAKSAQINAARNFAISKALERNTEWVLPLDGNIFMPEDALMRIINGLVWSQKASHKIHTIPFFRVISCQKELFDNDFVLWEEMRKSHWRSEKQCPAISERLSRKQEGQIAVSHRQPNVTSFFPLSRGYNKRSKLSVIQSLHKYKLRCGYGAGIEYSRKNFRQTLQDVKRCGYVLRLLYWPESDRCQSNEQEKSVEQIAEQLRNLPEAKMKIRHKLRGKSAQQMLQLTKSTTTV